MKKAPITTLKDISESTEEGRLLMASIATISTLPGFTNKTPDETLAHVNYIAWTMYGEENQGGEAVPVFGYCVNCKSNVALHADEAVYRCNLCDSEADPSDDAHEGNSI